MEYRNLPRLKKTKEHRGTKIGKPIFTNINMEKAQKVPYRVEGRQEPMWKSFNLIRLSAKRWSCGIM
jgi:hypothetical protein